MIEERDEVNIRCNRVAVIGVDVLLDCKLVKEEDTEKVSEIVAKEILARFAV